MEDRWRGPEDPDAENTESSRKKRRGGDFLSQYLARRRQEQVAQPEEDDDDESDEKPRKFRGFFKRLFGAMVQTPDSEEASQPQRSRLESFLAGAFIEKATDNQTGVDNGTPQESTTSDPSEYTPADSVELPPPTTATAGNRESSEAARASEPLVQEETEPVLERTELPQVRSVEVPRETVDTTVFERSSEPLAPQEKEVILERGSSVALPMILVGAEYLARKKADRKLNAKFTQKTEEITSDVKKERSRSEQLEQLVRQNREQLDALKRDRNIAVPRQEARPISTERIVPRYEATPQREAVSPNVEVKRPTISPEDAPKPETYKIMEQVAEAAEHDVPVERVFERSHEVKDDRTTPVGASSVAAIVAAKTSQRATAWDAHQNKVTGQDTTGLPVLTDDARTKLYHQAIKNGFWTAVIIIILGMIAYLVQ